ncbi:MAG: glycosyltransferase, partial [Roseinatronobacter sp.]
MSVAIILPAHDEAAWIGACIDAVLASRGDLPAAREIIIVANSCSDDTADIARTRSAAADAAGWTLRVFETAKPGKLSALNLAEAATTAKQRIYLDADVI